MLRNRETLMTTCSTSSRTRAPIDLTPYSSVFYRNWIVIAMLIELRPRPASAG